MPNLQQKIAWTSLHPATLSKSCPNHICMGTNQLQLLGSMEHPVAVLMKGCFAFRNKGCLFHLPV